MLIEIFLASSLQHVFRYFSLGKLYRCKQQASKLLTGLADLVKRKFYFPALNGCVCECGKFCFQFPLVFRGKNQVALTLIKLTNISRLIVELQTLMRIFWTSAGYMNVNSPCDLNFISSKLQCFLLLLPRCFSLTWCDLKSRFPCWFALVSNNSPPPRFEWVTSRRVSVIVLNFEQAISVEAEKFSSLLKRFRESKRTEAT